MATIKQVAERAGVSSATVSKYLNGAILKEKNRIAVEKAIKELDYKINPTAQGLRTGKSMTVGVLIPELDNLFATGIVSIIENTLIQRGYSTIICDYKTDKQLELEKLDFLLNRMVDGIVIMPLSLAAADLEKCRVPVVMIDRLVKGANADAVIVNNEKASYSAVQHLIENGHKRIGILIGPKEVYTSEERYNGYCRALSENGIEYDERYVLHGNYDIISGYDMINSLLALDTPPTAIFASNYELTLGAMMALNERNIDIPQSLSFVGFDNPEMAKAVKPGITIVTQPLEKIGETTAELLLDRMNKNAEEYKTVILDTTLLKQKSVAKAKEIKND